MWTIPCGAMRAFWVRQGARPIGAAAVLAMVISTSAAAHGAVVDFESFAQPPYSLGPSSYYNGADGAGGFTIGGAQFNNDYVDFGGGFYAWRGWAASDVADVQTPGYDNQYSAYALPVGGGAGGTTFFGVAFAASAGDAYIDLPDGVSPVSIAVTNTTYAALSMRDGDPFAKKFGGPTGADPDYFKLLIRGLDGAGAPVGEVDFYLADYRFADSSQDYIISDWSTVDLSPLAGARRLEFSFESSDVGMFGINTPTYVAVDNLTFTPEPTVAMALITVAALRRTRR